MARTLAFAALWWAVTESAGPGWPAGAAAVLAAVVASFLMIPPLEVRWRLGGILRFIPFFLQQSIRGGVDVAWRALHPRLPILPAIIEHRMTIPEGLPRVVLVNTLSLLPGTVAARTDGDRLTVHLLDSRLSSRERTEALEERVADVFGIELS